MSSLGKRGGVSLTITKCIQSVVYNQNITREFWFSCSQAHYMLRQLRLKRWVKCCRLVATLVRYIITLLPGIGVWGQLTNIHLRFGCITKCYRELIKLNIIHGAHVTKGSVAMLFRDKVIL